MAENSTNWGAIGTGATGLGQMAYGLYLQRKNKRPSYSIPDEIFQNLTQTQQAALEGMSEEQRMQWIQNIQRGTATGLSQLGSRKAGLAGLATINQQQNDAFGNVAVQDAIMKQQNQKDVLNARQALADYRDQSFQLNKLNPYYERVSEAQGYLGAGMQNMSNAGQMYAESQDYGQGKKKGDDYDYQWKKWSNQNWDPEKKSYREARKEFDSYYGGAEQYPYGGVVGDDKKKANKQEPQYELKREVKKKPKERYYLMATPMVKVSEEPQYELKREFKEVSKYPYGGVVDSDGYGSEVRSADYATEDATWNTVGQFGAIGKAIQGGAALGNAIGRPVRTKNEEVDENTGQLKNYKTSTTIGGAMLNPLTALQARSSYKGGFTDIDGTGYKRHLEANAKAQFDIASAQKAEAERNATISKYNKMLEASGQTNNNNVNYQNGNPNFYGKFPFGGKSSSDKVIEIEKKEVVKSPNGEVYAANASSHSDGGEKRVVKKGSIVFSDRIKVPGTNITFAEKAKEFIGDSKKMDDLFALQEKHKKEIGL